jgi:hypothetical protein
LTYVPKNIGVINCQCWRISCAEFTGTNFSLVHFLIGLNYNPVYSRRMKMRIRIALSKLIWNINLEMLISSFKLKKVCEGASLETSKTRSKRRNWKWLWGREWSHPYHATKACSYYWHRQFQDYYTVIYFNKGPRHIGHSLAFLMNSMPYHEILIFSIHFNLMKLASHDLFRLHDPM